MKRKLVVFLMAVCALAALIVLTQFGDFSSSLRGGTVITTVDWIDRLSGAPGNVAYADDVCVSSNVSLRQDAHRCYTDDDEIYDPCFASWTGFVCPESPFTRAYSLVMPIGALPGPVRAEASGDPWGIRLTGGISCTALGGATWLRGQKRNSYSCSNGLLLWGSPSKQHRLWEISVSRTFTSPMRTMQITEAIY